MRPSISFPWTVLVERFLSWPTPSVARFLKKSKTCNWVEVRVRVRVRAVEVNEGLVDDVCSVKELAADSSVDRSIGVTSFMSMVASWMEMYVVRKKDRKMTHEKRHSLRTHAHTKDHVTNY